MRRANNEQFCSGAIAGGICSAQQTNKCTSIKRFVSYHIKLFTDISVASVTVIWVSQNNTNSIEINA
jgi:hypothetical protein